MHLDVHYVCYYTTFVQRFDYYYYCCTGKSNRCQSLMCLVFQPDSLPPDHPASQSTQTNAWYWSAFSLRGRSIDGAFSHLPPVKQREYRSEGNAIYSVMYMYTRHLLHGKLIAWRSHESVCTMQSSVWTEAPLVRSNILTAMVHHHLKSVLAKALILPCLTFWQQCPPLPEICVGQSANLVLSDVLTAMSTFTWNLCWPKR